MTARRVSFHWVLFGFRGAIPPSFPPLATFGVGYFQRGGWGDLGLVIRKGGAVSWGSLASRRSEGSSMPSQATNASTREGLRGPHCQAGLPSLIPQS